MEPTVTDWLSALAAIATALFTLLLVFAAVWAAIAARDTLAQMRSDSESQRQDSARAARPYVHARMVPSLAGTDAWDLVVENTGRTAAYELDVNITPAEGTAKKDDLVTALAQRFADAGHTLHPGVSIRMYWVLGATEKDPTGYRRAAVSLRYKDSTGEPFEERPVTLDPDTVGVTPSPFTGTVRNDDDDPSIPRNTLYALRAIAHQVGELHR